MRWQSLDRVGSRSPRVRNKVLTICVWVTDGHGARCTLVGEDLPSGVFVHLGEGVKVYWV